MYSQFSVISSLKSPQSGSIVKWELAIASSEKLRSAEPCARHSGHFFEIGVPYPFHRSHYPVIPMNFLSNLRQLLSLHHQQHT